MNDRNFALDLLRGLTIALMIIVNNPGDWSHMFGLLRHAAWHGFSGADIVFPFFLFVSGYAAALNIDRRYLPIRANGPHCASSLTIAEPATPPYYGRLIRRSAVLFAIGLFLNAWPFGMLPGTEFHLEQLRIPGVLQRIALCVLGGGIILRRTTKPLKTATAIAVLIVIYECGMRFVTMSTPAGNYGRSFELADNFARWFDLQVLPASMLYHVRGVPFDPEGIFTTLTAIASFLLGGLAYQCKGSGGFYLFPAIVIAALVFASLEPINKNLWTPAFVFLTASLALAALRIVEIFRQASRFWLLTPFASMGRNALVLYAASVLLGKTLALWKLPTGTSAKQAVFGVITLSGIAAEFSSLLYSLLLLFLVAGLAHGLRRTPLRA